MFKHIKKRYVELVDNSAEIVDDFGQENIEHN